MDIKSCDVEWFIAQHFGVRMNIVVPNVSWGLFGLNYEADLLILTPAGYCTEVEVKISKSDLKADFKKLHTHNSRLVHCLYYAFPEKMRDCVSLIPDNAGILIVDPENKYNKVDVFRYAKKNKNPVWSEEKRYELLRLAYMRVWTLKEHLLNIRKNKRDLQTAQKKEAR